VNPFSLHIASAALADMDAIAEFIRRDNPARAASFIEELSAKVETVAERPMSFPARTDLKPGLRSAVHGRYLIIFQVGEDQVRILRVLHGARDIQSLF
jgi:toxin ParE1/3/4